MKSGKKVLSLLIAFSLMLGQFSLALGADKTFYTHDDYFQLSPDELLQMMGEKKAQIDALKVQLDNNQLVVYSNDHKRMGFLGAAMLGSSVIGLVSLQELIGGVLQNEVNKNKLVAVQTMLDAAKAGSVETVSVAQIEKEMAAVGLTTSSLPLTTIGASLLICLALGANILGLLTPVNVEVLQITEDERARLSQMLERLSNEISSIEQALRDIGASNAVVAQ
ncbi:MAG: hypothetical protein AB7F43_10820 [Bacteriovoracia bacterium]